MLTLTPLQSTGGSPIVVTLALATLLVTAVLSLAVAVLLVRGYRRNRDRARLYLGLGLVFLTTVPILVQFALTNAGLSPELRSAAANGSKLVGLAAMLYAIYGITRSHRVVRSERKSNPDPRPGQSEEDSS
ncbi:DUF7521 family protein [Natronosalvus caseinilyticus]|uniref:DUF7521 family protein n=1 Tax=Natronosalvus caseinilyticus TaxID=2953747 RepID=UPI0028B0331D|nr:DUF5985 family protein [Natronosalvus caseinilyticus]